MRRRSETQFGLGAGMRGTAVPHSERWRRYGVCSFTGAAPITRPGLARQSLRQAHALGTPWGGRHGLTRPTYAARK